ncbi:type II secretion system protein N [Glaciimonas sp. GG7]
MRKLTIACLWLIAALLSVLLTVCLFLPAAWIAPLLEAQTDGRLTLGDAQGSLWNGSAFIGAAPSAKDAVTPLLPGRFSWRVTPLILVGRVDVTLENPEVLSEPIVVRGSWLKWTVSAASMALPAERLASLGAPLNTLQPSGKLLLSWQEMTFERQLNGFDCHGLMTLDMLAMTTRVSSVKPLGSYRLTFDWRGQKAGLVLQTSGGSLLLDGTGTLENTHFAFSGTAQAAPGQEEKLAGLLSLLGQPRRENGKNMIGLEFTS